MASSRVPRRWKPIRQRNFGPLISKDEDVQRTLVDLAGRFDQLNRTISRAEDVSTKAVAGIVPRIPEGPVMLERFDARVAEVDEQIRTLRARAGERAGAAGASAGALQLTRARIRAELERLEDFVRELSTEADGAEATAAASRGRAEVAVLATDDRAARGALARAKEHDGLARHLRAEIELTTRVMAELRTALATTDPDAP